MKTTSIFITVILSLFASVSVCSAGTEKTESGWTPLFNGKNLDGFDTFLGRYTKDQLNHDPANIISVHDGMIHIYQETPQGTKVPCGYFATQKEYSHFHLRFEYKWGKKKFAPRTNTVRDSGVIYHMVGPHKVWPRGVECQVQEGDTGDIFLVSGTVATTTVDPKLKESKPRPIIKYLDAKKGGVPFTQGPKSMRVIKGLTTENDGWNTVEVIVHGSQSFVHIVNGVINNKGTNIRQVGKDNKGLIPLKKGKILFQVEGAEVLYRNIEIKELQESE